MFASFKTTKIFVFSLFFVFLFNIFFPSLVFATEEVETSPIKSFDEYASYFYDRYSRHLDVNGMIFETPGYGVGEFRAPESAREIMSLALCHKYRAMRGEREARQVLRQAILDADAELSARELHTQSFSDAFVAMATMQILDEVPFLLSAIELERVYGNVISRVEYGINAPDTSNRAALSAVYWQYTINNLHRKHLISDDDKKYYDKLIYQKIKNVLETDIDKYGWYREGDSMQFNPHYHFVTAFAFLSYYEATGYIEFYIIAKEMTKNLRAISFPNGMIEARIGARPVGLGSQFYLGVALLNYRFGYDDYSVYLDFAYGDQFFSDPRYPDRLEYHSTIEYSRPEFHDDISFSNLTELARLIPSLRSISTDFTSLDLENIPVFARSHDFHITNSGKTICQNERCFTQTTPHTTRAFRKY